MKKKLSSVLPCLLCTAGLLVATACLHDTSKVSVTNDAGILIRTVDVYGDGRVVRKNITDRYNSFAVEER